MTSAFGAPRQIDVLVIGAGVVGVASAWYLQAAGARVTLLDRGRVCSGASYGNAGLVVPSHSVPLAEPAALSHGLRWLFRPDSPFYIKPRLDTDLLRWLWGFRRAATPKRVEAAIPLLRDLHLASRELYAGFAAAGLDFGWGQRGRVLVCDSDAGLAAAVDEARHMEHAGLTAEVLDAGGIARVLGGLQPRCAGGVFYPQDAHLDPARFVHALARRAIAAGVDLVEDAEVLQIHGEDGAGSDPGGRVRHVVTTRGVFAPRQVVLATGAWSPALGAQLGLRLPIQPAKGYSVELDAPGDTPDVPFMLAEAKVAVTPLGPAADGGPGRLRLAGTLELAGLDLSINRRRVDALIGAVPRYLPAWDPAGFRVREVWRGLRPCTPDGLPLLGRSRRWRNLVVAAGHAMIGLSLGPVTGRLVAQLAGDETPELDLTLLDPERFT